MRSIKFKKPFLIVFLMLLPLLLSLGFWQLNRAEQKKEQIRLQEQRLNEAPVTMNPDHSADTETLLYRNLQLTGRYDAAHQILQDNQFSEGKAGYFVLTPFVLEDSRKAILVNRGWLPYAPERTGLPVIPVLPVEQISVTGTVNRFSRPGIILDGADKPSKSWPAVVQVINTGVLKARLEYDFFDFQLELAKSEANGFKRDWQHAPAMPPEKHVAYAVQWFLLALTLAVLFFVYGMDKK